MSAKRVPPPPPRRRGLAAIPIPQTTAPVDNLSRPNSGVQDLNFKVEPDFHRAFKTTATIKGMSMKELLEASFSIWIETYGDDTIRSLIPRLTKK